MRIHELAIKFHVTSKELLEICENAGLKEKKTASSTLRPEELQKIGEYLTRAAGGKGKVEVRLPPKNKSGKTTGEAELKAEEKPPEKKPEAKTEGKTKGTGKAAAKKETKAVKETKETKEAKKTKATKESKEAPEKKADEKKAPEKKEAGKKEKEAVPKEAEKKPEEKTVAKPKAEVKSEAKPEAKAAPEKPAPVKPKEVKAVEVKPPEAKPPAAAPVVGRAEVKKPEEKKPAEIKPEEIKPKLKPVAVKGNETVAQLAEKLGVSTAQAITSFMTMRLLYNQNQQPGAENMKRVGLLLGYEVTIEEAPAPVEEAKVEDRPEDLKPRSPVVTIMGHVDHGKTTILDAVRKSRIALKEFGQITQKIGAYKVNLPAGSIVFLDTPGHEAFTEMRVRGARITDIVILVVAADDGIMPQTVEAIHHAKSAEVPIIVAVNKVDKPNANPDRVKQQLSEHGLLPESWGGDTVVMNVSGVTGQGLKELLEMIVLVAELQELKANPNKPAQGIVIESQLDRTKGPVITVLMQAGTLRVGDIFVVGETFGKVRALIDDWNNRVSEAGPSTPIEILGANEVVPPGAKFRVVDSEKEAREIMDRIRQGRVAKAAPERKLTLEELYQDVKKGVVKELKLVLKADYAGSIEAIKNVLSKIPQKEVQITPIHIGTGPITESDILLASASNGVVMGFNVPYDAKAQEIAKREGVEVKTYKVIYDLADEVHKAVEGMLEPQSQETLTGQAVVKKVFSLSKNAVIAGCLVVDGKLVRDAKVKIIRDGKTVHEGRLSSLRRFKDTVKEVPGNTECGVEMASFRDFKEGDIIQSYLVQIVQRKLE